MLGVKHRLRFEKSGDLRLVSHLDLHRCIERLCRRADIPFKLTQGFHPAPRILFALALPLGATGRNEVLEIELNQSLEADVLLERMRAQSPIGMQFLSAYAIDLKTCAEVRRAIYRLELTDADREIALDNVPKLLNLDKAWAARFKPRPRQVNVRPYLRELIVEENALIMDFWVTSFGTARADEVIALLGLPSPFDSGAALERSDLELHDETYPGLPDAPPPGRPELKPLEPSSAIRRDEPEPAIATWGLSPNGPVVE